MIRLAGGNFASAFHSAFAPGFNLVSDRNGNNARMSAPDDFFACDYFALFGLSQNADIDNVALRAQYQRLQATAHPDRFAGKSEGEKRLAMQMAGRINDAFLVLQNPLARAAYLLELRGVSAFAEDNTAMPPEFLMQQIEWREGLEEGDESERESLLREISAAREDAEQRTVAALKADDLEAATGAVREWKYLEKMLAENHSPDRASSDGSPAL